MKVEDGEKAAEKWVEDFVVRGKLIPDADWTAAPSWKCWPAIRSHLPRYGPAWSKVARSRVQAEAKYAEADGVQRVARLAETFDEASWPIALVRKALVLMHKGEQASARPHAFPWFAGALEHAAQKRHDAETLLFARGYVALSAVETPLTEALREYEAILAKQDVMEDALRAMDEALAQLPGYAACVDFFPGADPIWHEAVRGAHALQTLLRPPVGKIGLAPPQLNSRVEEARIKTEGLQGSMRQLKQLHSAEALDDLLARSTRPDADMQTYRSLRAQWSVPFQAPEMRGKIWDALTTLGAKLADKILEDESDITAMAQAPADELRDLQEARSVAAKHAARSLALLRLTGLDAVRLDSLEQMWEGFARITPIDAAKAPVEKRDGYVLAQGLRQAWTQDLPQQMAAEKDPLVFERVGRVAPEWLRLGAKEELLAKSAALIAAKSERALWAWLADRYRYASREPDASAFVMRAAFALRDFAPPDTLGFSLPAAATVAGLTPKAGAAFAYSRAAGKRCRRNGGHPPFSCLAPTRNGCRSIPNSQLGKLTTLPANQGGVIELPLLVALNPQAELSVSPRPSGFLFGLKFAGRTYHHKVQLPLLPSAGRVEILLSDDPKQPAIPLGDLRLRPSKERQSFYIYVNKLDEKARNLIVELQANRCVPPGGKVEITRLPGKPCVLHSGPTEPQ